MKCGKSFALLGAVLLICSLSQPVECFIPTKLYNFLAAVSEFSGPRGITHVAMTRNAILRVAADLLKDIPFDDDSTQRISALGSDFDENELVMAYYGGKRRKVTKLFEEAIEDIGDGNIDVDDREAAVPSAHFDAEQFQNGQNRLTDLRRTVVDRIRGEEYEEARSETGRMLHTLQDFYSHSNWVEMGNTEPYSGLGQYDERPVVASPSTPTCTDCRQIGRVMLGFVTSIDTAQYHYQCEGNIRGDILSARLLTSGYYSNQFEERIDEDSGELLREMVEKPSGKCSHGGYFDATSDEHATGGINKDSPYSQLSPHSSQHFPAATLAEQATVNILNEIRVEVNDDRKFGAYLNLFVKTAASVAYVIDTTGSMGEELPQIQATIPQIRSSLEQYKESIGESAVINYILVPFNDPDPGLIYETNDIEVFLSGIASLHADGGGDAPEPSIGALIRAIKASEEGSPIFVFTDASASDSYRLQEAQALIAQKSVTVTFAFVAFSRKRSTNDHMQVGQFEETKRQARETYETLAIFSGGQVLNLGTSDLSDLGELVRFSADQERTTIFRETEAIGPFKTFYIDSSIEQAIISINGYGLGISLTSPSGVPATSLDEYSVSLQSSSSFIATLTINSSDLLGEWQISLQVGYLYTYDIVIYAISDLRFSSQLFAFDPASSYRYTVVEGKPLNGIPLITAFQANDHVIVETVNLVDSTGAVLQTIKDVLILGDNAFATSFTPPSVLFYWQILGKYEEKYAFSRISDTAIGVSDIDLMLGEGESGYYTLRPGDSITIPVELFNSGYEADFSLNIDQAAFGNSSLGVSAYLSDSHIRVGENSTEEFQVFIAAFKNATDGYTSTLTLVAQSTLDESNDFAVFKVTITTRRLPEFTDNKYGEPSSATELSGYLLVLCCAVLVILRESIAIM